MIISLIRRQLGKDFVNSLKDKYQSTVNLEKIVEKTNNMKLLVDLENWKYYEENPDESIDEEFTFISDNWSFNEIDYEIISTIKEENPKSLRHLSKLMQKNMVLSAVC